ncbi:hypothetical protein GCM10009646_22950 [Streptomyces aureus]
MSQPTPPTGAGGRQVQLFAVAEFASTEYGPPAVFHRRPCLRHRLRHHNQCLEASREFHTVAFPATPAGDQPQAAPTSELFVPSDPKTYTASSGILVQKSERSSQLAQSVRAFARNG